MTYHSEGQASGRAPRVRFAEMTPAVVRFKDGRRVPGRLKVVSLTGGLLGLRKPLAQGLTVKLMFVTRAGSVLGTAEMLRPVADELQPFRFVRLFADDQRRLQAAIVTSQEQNLRDQKQLDNYPCPRLRLVPPK